MIRLDFVDVAKGLGIFIVVLGHCLVYSGLGGSNLFWYIYAFHMPFWFLISGFLYKQKDPKSYIAGKVTALLVPYVAYFSVNILIYAILASVGLTGIYDYCRFGAFWFLSTLFVIVIIHYFLDVFLYSRSKHGLLIQCIVALVVLVLGLTYARHLVGKANQTVATAFVAYAYFLLGSFLRRFNLRPPMGKLSRIGCFCMGLCLSGVLLLTVKNNGSQNIDMCENRYMNELLFVLNSLLCIASFMLLSLAIARNKVLQNMGRNSLTILMIHLIVCRFFFFVCGFFWFYGYISVVIGTALGFISSYIAIWLFEKYIPFMLGKIDLNKIVMHE